MKFQRQFENPPAEYRIKPFWFWNGEMTKEEIRRQIKEMADKGLGGMFICARQGMDVPYLSKEWFDLTVYACDAAREFGLEAWLYDEYPYPSGMSGGEVLLEHPEAEHTVLGHKSFLAEGGVSVEADLGWARILFAKAFPVETGADGREKTDWDHGLDLKTSVGVLQTEKIYQRTGLTKYNNKRFFSYGPQKILRTVLPEGRWRIEVYSEAPLGDFKYYGGFFDPCDQEAVQTFLETTHERYRKAVGERFGISVHGMFSDEVGLLGPIPWSRRLPAAFRERKGYDLLERLPAIHHREIPDSGRVRYDLYETAHDLFRESYHRQVSDWCKENRLLYATEVPSMRQGTQKYSDIVGGDTAHEKLGKPLEWIYDEYIRNFRSNAKSVSSLARQLGKRYAMIESFHSVGWTMTLQDAKWMIDRLGASGINLYNFHAFYYTIQDITKHDAPPSQFLQNPYWKHYRKLADYVARMGVLVTETEADISVAVLDPAAALWSLLGNPFNGFPYAGEDEEERKRCDHIRDTWVKVCKTLLFAQIDYEHLDYEMLAEARIENGQILIGRARYSAVVLPPCPCMERGARERLWEFAAQGGRIIGIGELPSQAIDEDGEPAEKWKTLFGAESARLLPEDGWETELIRLCREASLDRTIRRVVSGNPRDVITCSRIGEDGSVFVFGANQGRGEAVIEAELSGGAAIKFGEVWDLETGRRARLPLADGICRMQLGAYESRWVRLAPEGAGLEPSEKASMDLPVVKIPFAGKKDLSLEGRNLCRLGEYEMSLDGKEWKPVEAETFIEQCHKTGLLEGDLLEYGGSFGTPRKLKAAYPISCQYRMEFEAEEIPEELFLLMDRESVAGEREILVNGTPIPEKAFRPVRVNDQNNRAASLEGLVRTGRNTILIRCTVRKDEDGLRDPIYLWGTFGVKPRRPWPVIGKLPERAEARASWVEGIPYYSGTYCLSGEVNLELPKGEAFFLEPDLGCSLYDCIELVVNGQSLGVKGFAPYRWECGRDSLYDGVNQISVKITNTLANMLDGTYFDYDAHRLVDMKEE